jgi:hypothetical protein
MKARLHDKSPRSAPLPTQTEPENGVVLLKIELPPTSLRFANEVSNFVPVMHFVAGVGGKIVNFLPGQLSELQKRWVNDSVPFFMRPLACLSPRPDIPAICFGDAP